MSVSKTGRVYTQSDTRSFDAYLHDEGITDEIDIAAEKMFIAHQLDEARRSQKITKAALAESLGTSRAQIDRVLDRHNQNVTIETLKRVAAVLGKRLKIELI